MLKNKVCLVPIFLLVALVAIFGTVKDVAAQIKVVKFYDAEFLIRESNPAAIYYLNTENVIPSLKKISLPVVANVERIQVIEPQRLLINGRKFIFINIFTKNFMKDRKDDCYAKIDKTFLILENKQNFLTIHNQAPLINCLQGIYADNQNNSEVVWDEGSKSFKIKFRQHPLKKDGKKNESSQNEASNQVNNENNVNNNNQNNSVENNASGTEENINNNAAAPVNNQSQQTSAQNNSVSTPDNNDINQSSNNQMVNIQPIDRQQNSTQNQPQANNNQSENTQNQPQANNNQSGNTQNQNNQPQDNNQPVINNQNQNNQASQTAKPQLSQNSKNENEFLEVTLGYSEQAQAFLLDTSE